MLVCAWDALDAAITPLEARENLAQYTVAVVASPYVEEQQRESVVGGWRRVLENGRQFLREVVSTNGYENGTERKPKPTVYLEDGTILQSDPNLDRPLAQVFAKVKSAFGVHIRD